MRARLAQKVALAIVATLTVSSCALDGKPSEVESTTPGVASSQSGAGAGTGGVGGAGDAVPPATMFKLALSGSPEEFSVTPSAETQVIVDETHGAEIVATVDAAKSGGFRIEVAAPDGASLRAMSDRSVAVLTAEGVLVGGLAAPSVTTAAGVSWSGAWRIDEAGSAIDYLGTVDAAASPLTVSLYVGSGLVSALIWGNREGGESLGVQPTAWGRKSGLVGRDFGFTEVVAAYPETDTEIMRNQFYCHFDGALDKKQWNIEPWRPDVGYLSYVLAKCNPTA